MSGKIIKKTCTWAENCQKWKHWFAHDSEFSILSAHAHYTWIILIFEMCKHMCTWTEMTIHVYTCLAYAPRPRPLPPLPRPRPRPRVVALPPPLFWVVAMNSEPVVGLIDLIIATNHLRKAGFQDHNFDLAWPLDKKIQIYEHGSKNIFETGNYKFSYFPKCSIFPKVRCFQIKREIRQNQDVKYGKLI